MYAGMIGGVLVSIGAWQFAWTTWSSIHWLVPLIGITILYSGLLQIYLTAFNYVTDAYTGYAASALAARTSLLQDRLRLKFDCPLPFRGFAVNLGRNLLAAAVPLFGNQLYERLDIHVPGSLVASLATALTLVPLLIFRYGAWLRERSKVSQLYAGAP